MILEVIGIAVLGVFLMSRLAVDCHEYEICRDDFEIFGDE